MASAQEQQVATPDQTLQNRPQNGTTATLNNHTVAAMQLIRSHNWSGRFTTLPNNIRGHGGVARIDHANGVLGSKAGVMYTITSAAGAPYAVALAWHAPTNFNPTTSPNRVYAVCGPRPAIERLTWEHILTQLDRSGSTFAINDELSKISVHGTIINNPSTNMANLLTNFLIMP